MGADHRRSRPSNPADRPGPGVGRAAIRRLVRASRRIDDVRIREHLRRAERDLRARDVDHLDPETRRRRERHLDRLRRYRRRGAFPRNEEHPERTPCFRGANGTPCAVAFLLLEDGRKELVADVAETDNAVRIESVEDGTLLDWIEANGFTKAEAARIQPSYPVGIEFATDCGPVSCTVARLLASLAGLAAFAALEYVGYRVVGDLFPGNAIKRRGALAYLTVLNLLTSPLIAVLLYALLP